MSGMNAVKCARCGACLSVCPVYEITGHERLSPRGKQELINWAIAEGCKPSRDSRLSQTINACLQCNACSSVCSAGVKVDALIREARQKILPKGGLPWWLKSYLREQGASQKIFRLLKSLPGTSGLVSRLTGLLASGARLENIPELAPVPALQDDHLFRGVNSRSQKNVVSLFVGCIQNYLYTRVVESMAQWFGSGTSAPASQGCCGLPAFSAGDIALARTLIRKNLEAFKGVDSEIIVTGCASCASMIRRWPELISLDDPLRPVAEQMAEKVREFTEAVVQYKIVPEGLEKTYLGPALLHMPCHQRFGQGSVIAPKALMEGLFPGDYEIFDSCCGQGGLFSLNNPKLSAEIFRRGLNVLLENELGAVFTTCSGCLLQWRTRIPTGPGMPVVLHPAEILNCSNDLS